MAKKHSNTLGTSQKKYLSNEETPSALASEKMAAGVFRDWQPRWQDFLSQFPEWRGSTPSDQPVYWVPEVVVSALAAPTPYAMASARRTPAALINPAEAKAENAFRDCCVGYGGSVVGVWANSPVIFQPLSAAPLPVVSKDLMRSLGWDRYARVDALAADLAALQSNAIGVVHQQLAYAGYLITSDKYQHDKRVLFEQWQHLDSPVSWPLLANTADKNAVAVLTAKTGNGRHLSAKLHSFLENATTFMRKWSLCRLSTWDLPLLQGPLEQLPLEQQRELLGPNQIVSTYSKPYTITSNQDMRGKIRDQQHWDGKAEGVDDFPLTNLAPRKGRANKLENVFRLWFIESALRHRYPKRRGLATRLGEVFKKLTFSSTERIKQLRRCYRRLVNSDGD